MSYVKNVCIAAGPHRSHFQFPTWKETENYIPYEGCGTGKYNIVTDSAWCQNLWRVQVGFQVMWGKANSKRQP